MSALIETWPVFWLSLWHMLLPGHMKTLLLAVRVSGATRREVVMMAAGFALSHGVLMVGALYGGSLVTGWISGLAPGGRILLAHAYVPLLLVFALYFGWRACGMRFQQAAAAADRKHLRGHGKALQGRAARALAGGALLGSIPCSGVLGFAFIGPALMQTSMVLIPSLTAAWLGVLVAACGLACAACLIPADRLKRHFAPWLPYAASSILCLAIAILRGYQLWSDWRLLG